MLLARVAGTVVASHKHDAYVGFKILVVQPLDLDGIDVGEPLLAADTVGAGAGETVVVVIEGRSTSQAMRIDHAPANAAIVGIVDRIDRDGLRPEHLPSSQENSP